MIKTIHDLDQKTKVFALFCTSQFSLCALVNKSQMGINHAECSQFGIAPDQWQDAILVAIKMLGERY